MTHRQDAHEEWVIRMLENIVALDHENRDAISGKAMARIKEALTILRKHRHTRWSELERGGAGGSD